MMTEKLYNGIELPAEWPPRHLDRTSDTPMPVPYLQAPPAVIPIDVGRQLFVDDFLISDSTLTRTFHRAGFASLDAGPQAGMLTTRPVSFTGTRLFVNLRGRPVRFRFELTDGELYAFWVSRDNTGRSDGYVAAGGPGYTGHKDTVGRAAYESGAGSNKNRKTQP